MELDSAENPGRFFVALSRDLKSLALSNIQYFQNGKQSHHAKFHVTFSLLYEYLDIGIEPSYRELSKHLNQYDFSSDVKGNGYRSLLRVVQKCCLHLLQLSRYISSVRDSILFRRKVYAKELESYVSALGQLRAVLYYALKLIHYCQDGELFADEARLSTEVAEQLILDVETLSQESFYGRCLGFQFSSSMQRPLQVLAIAMASYSEGYLESSQMMQVATSVFNSGKYFLDPELRAQQMVKVTRTADIKFCKAFWGFSESTLMHQLPSFVCPSVEVNEVITLGPDSFELPLVDGSDTVVITPPCAHTGPGHVYTRLISAQLREGQLTMKKTGKAKTPPATKPATPGLVLHIHGGGFVAHSSKSHEVYLRDWAVTLGVPILSVDYSLAPEYPFPRALEECFYAYAWAVQNSRQLGSTGETIVLTGDSAGANLAISTAMRAASFGIRAPDSILAIYPCTMVRYTPSPARLLSLMDPILPVGLVTRCLAAYAGINEQHPLATPRMDDVHSEQSLSSLQMGSYESSDDWIIIAQDEQEVDKLRSHAQAVGSPVDAGNQSVIDAMEDSFDGDSQRSVQTSSKRPVISPVGEKERSGSVESEEVELFCRLQAEGSCVFPSDKEISDINGQNVHPAMPGRDQAGGAETLPNSVAVTTTSPGGPESDLKQVSSVPNFGGIFQERARQVVEGAQNMLTSLSLYIPSTTNMAAQSVMSSVSSLLSPASSTQLVAATAESRPVFFSDLDALSDGVDDVSGQCPTASEVEVSMDTQSTDQTTANPSDAEVAESSSPDSSEAMQGMGRPDTTSAVSDLQTDPSTSGTSKIHHSDTGQQPDGDIFRQTATDHRLTHTTQQLDNESHDPDIQRDRNSNLPMEVSPDSDVVLDASMSSSIPTSSSQLFDTAHSSPISSSQHALPESASLDNMDSVSLSSESSHHGYHSAGERPSSHGPADKEDRPGVNPGPEVSSQTPDLTCSNSHTQQTGKSPDSGTVPQDLANCGADTVQFDSTDHFGSQTSDNPGDMVVCDVSGAEKSGRVILTGSRPPLETHEEHSTIDLRMLSPQNPTTVFSQDYFSSSPISPSVFPNLPEERKQLLEDALQTVDSPHALSPPATDPMNGCNDSLTLTQPQISAASPVDTIGLCDQPGSDLGSVDQCETTTFADETGASQTAEPQSSSPLRSGKTPVPPKSLNLKMRTKPDPRHTSVLSPSSPARVFGTDPEPFETLEPDLTFESSRLELISPSSTTEESKPRSSSSPTSSRSDGFIRSGSVPALTSMLSPNPTPSQPAPGPGPVLFPYGLKAGMSPSDFQKQNYVAHSPLHSLRKAPVVNNPYMSPLMAPEDLLKGLNKVCIVGCHLDPLLDDSVMFARRLRELGVPVSLQLVDDLPHGFLNFALLSLEAKQASDLCSRKLLEMLNSSGQGQRSLPV